MNASGDAANPLAFHGNYELCILRHVHIQGWNTTKKTTTCNFWYRHS